MAVPSKNVSVEELEKALEAALLAVSGRTVKVSVGALRFNEVANRVDVEVTAWDKVSEDPFKGAI